MAFGVVVDGDDSWPELWATDEEGCTTMAVAQRLAWFEAVLRLHAIAREEGHCFLSSKKITDHGCSRPQIVHAPAR